MKGSDLMLNRSPTRALAAVLLFTTVAAQAGDLNAPFMLDTAETLPANVRNPRFIDIFASVTTKFGSDGHTTGLGDPLNKFVKWNDVFKEQEDSAKRTLVRGILKANGIDESGGPGFTTGQVNTFADVKVAALAWGITNRFTVAAVVPIIKVDVNASTGFVASDDPHSDYQRFLSALSQNQSPLTAQEATGQFNDAVNRKLVRLGYDPIPANETISGIGDAQLIGKYRIYNDGVNGVSLKGTLMFPTGTAPNADKALDIPTGTGTVGASLGMIYDRKLPLDLRWDNFASYTALLPHHIDKRIPLAVDDPLSADKESMYEHARSQVLFGTGLEEYFPRTGILLGAGYSFQFQERANYQPGSTYGEDRYYLLGDQEPVETLHSVILSAGFSTIEWYNRKKFVYPFQVNFSYSHPIAGINVPSGDLFAGELVVFF